MSLPDIPRDAPSLRELQRHLAAHVLAADPRPLAPLDRWLAVPAGTAPGERLAVHVDGYPARLHEALAQEFPAVAHLVGAGRFHALVHRYRRAAALPSYNLNDAGAELPDVLRADPLAAELPFLPDLAALEWALTRAFHAADLPPVTPARLATLGPEAIVAGRVCFQPSVAVRVSPWPIHTLWEARETPHDRIDIDLTVGEQVLVWRAGLRVECAPIEPARAAALQALLAGETVAAVAERHGDPTTVVSWLGDCLARGLVVECGPSAHVLSGSSACAFLEGAEGAVAT
jgi:hypothetical protein